MGGAPLLKPESVEALTTNAIDDLRVNPVGPGWGFGLGVAVLKDPVLAESPESAGTWRWGGAYGHSWFVDPARRLSVVALTNTAVAGMNGPYPECHPRRRLWCPAVITHPGAPGKPARSG